MNLCEEDYLPKKDNMASPKVSYNYLEAPLYSVSQQQSASQHISIQLLGLLKFMALSVL